MNNPRAVKPSSAMQVLVIDDQQQVRHIVRESLFRLGFRHVLLAANAAEALRLLRGESIDLVLSDYNLGEGPDGQQLLEAARGERLLSPVAPWIYITANALRTDIMAERCTNGRSSAITQCESTPWSAVTSWGSTTMNSRTASLMYCTLVLPSECSRYS